LGALPHGKAFSRIRSNGIEPYLYLVWLFTSLPPIATADDYAARQKNREIFVDTAAKTRTPRM
jgi:hypothetical protein